MLIEPHDIRGWVTALTDMIENVEMRREFSGQSQILSRKYTWDQVGRRRLCQYEAAAQSVRQLN